MKTELTPFSKSIIRNFGWILLVGFFAFILLRTNKKEKPISTQVLAQEQAPEYEPIEPVKPIPAFLLSSYDVKYNQYQYRGTPENLASEIDGFADSWAYIAKHKTDSQSKAWEKRIINMQIKELPLLRKECGNEMDNKLWEEDVRVAVSGKGNKTITFTGYHFASNKGIKETQESLYSTLVKFRFNLIIYKWYKGQEDYQYFKLNTPNDSAPY